MSYTIDIYRGQLKPLGNWCDYLFYLSFFPSWSQARSSGPGLHPPDPPQPGRRDARNVRHGSLPDPHGTLQKAIISDYISLNFVDRIFDEPLLYSGFECLAGIYGYALQIYCDFSGYSDMAIGIALLLGFRFPKNFDAPYKSATITEFWRRWHISLSPRGCAITSTSRWAATAKANCAPTATCSSRWCWVGCGTVRRSASSSGARCMA